MLALSEMKFGILLTSTIRPHITSFTKRTRPQTREQDYCDVVRALAHTNFPVVFCDSSDYSLAKVQAAFGERQTTSYELLQFDGNIFPPERGKGYGELQIISYALRHSHLLNECDFIVKITGRYRVENLEEIIREIHLPDSVSVVADYSESSRYTYSGFFIARPQFLTQYLIPYLSWVDDSQGRHFEMALHQAIREAGGACAFSVVPRISGYSGTWNVKMQKGNYKDIAMSLPKVRIVLLAYWKQVTHRLQRFWQTLRY